jgi:putative ATPase
MREMGYGRGYRYAHDYDKGIVGQQNLPQNLGARTYYEPTDRGFERELSARLERIRRIYETTEDDQAGEDPTP